MQKGGSFSNKENRINGWWINENPYSDSQARANEKARDQRNEFKVYYCKSCSSCYQIDFTYYKNGYEVLYYKDFPSYRLKRKRCPKC
tara:strand:- start:793 stop:1053 length:261 start_codon:yes stop_codon:yes gene_type:complete